jgi:hypothetical protein
MWDETDVSDGTSDRHSLNEFMRGDFSMSSIPYASNLFRDYEPRTITAILIPQCPGCDCAIAMTTINSTIPSITGLCFIMWNID